MAKKTEKTAAPKPEAVETAESPNPEAVEQSAGQPLAVQEAAGELAPNSLMDNDGFGEIDANDMSIPFLKLLQDNSPQRKKADEQFVEGAEEGMILNTVSEELYPTEDGQGIIVVPVYIEKATVEWAPRDDGGGGGGFVARHPWDYPQCVRLKNEGVPPNKWRSSDGNILKRTYYLWVLIIDPNMPDPDPMDLRNYAIISFESSKAPVFQQWVSKAKKATLVGEDGRKSQVPLWRLMLKLGAKYTPGSKGSYYNYTLGFANPENFEGCGWKDSIIPTDSSYYEAAVVFREAITSGLATANVESEERVSGGGGGDEDDMPF